MFLMIFYQESTGFSLQLINTVGNWIRLLLSYLITMLKILILDKLDSRCYTILLTLLMFQSPKINLVNKRKSLKARITSSALMKKENTISCHSHALNLARKYSLLILMKHRSSLQISVHPSIWYPAQSSLKNNLKA